jgi:signal transduction histidine kinase
MRKLKKENFEMSKIIKSLDERMQGMIYSSMMIGGLVNDLLDLAKQQVNTFSLNGEFFSLPGMIKQTTQIMRYLAKMKKVTFHFKYKGHVNISYFDQIFSDRNRIQQILLNFTSNALKFSKENG